MLQSLVKWWSYSNCVVCRHEVCVRYVWSVCIELCDCSSGLSQWFVGVFISILFLFYFCWPLLHSSGLLLISSFPWHSLKHYKILKHWLQSKQTEENVYIYGRVTDVYTFTITTLQYQRCCKWSNWPEFVMPYLANISINWRCCH